MRRTTAAAAKAGRATIHLVVGVPVAALTGSLVQAAGVIALIAAAIVWPIAGRHRPPPRPGGASVPEREASTMRWIPVCTAALFAAACGSTGPMAPMHTDAESQVYTEPMTRIVLTDLGPGDLTLRATSGPAVTVAREVHWRGTQRPEITETWEGQTLRVSYRCLTPNCSVDYEVGLPATVEVHAETTSGNVDVHGMSAPVVLQTTSGDVSLSEVSGDITLKATSGTVQSSDLGSGAVTVSTTSGDIGLDFAAAPKAVSVRATSGDTTITVPPGQSYAVHVQTGSGDQKIDVDRSQSAPAKIDAESTSGDVRIGYGRGRIVGTPSPSR